MADPFDAEAAALAPGTAVAAARRGPRRRAAATDCTDPLLVVGTGPGSTCGDGAPVHAYPPAGGCHCWASTDSTCKQRDNSVTGMRCDEDGSFLLEQHTNLDCSGTGKTKTVRLDECEQDVPQTLYSRGTGLACRADPASPDCVTAMPYATAVEGRSIYLDNELCNDATGATECAGDTGAAAGNPADWLESGADYNRSVSEAEMGS